MSETKKALARYDAAVQKFATLLANAIGSDPAETGYDLIEGSVRLQEIREPVLAVAEGWMLEYIAVSSAFITTLTAFVRGTSKAEDVQKAHAAYDAMRNRHFDTYELIEAA